MASHILHDPIGEAGLNDECERCLEIARRPTVHLDATNLPLLWGRMIRVKLDGSGEIFRSNAEAEAANYLYNLWVDIEKLRNARCTLPGITA